MTDPRTILDPLEVPTSTKADAWDAFQAPDEATFRAKMDAVRLPNEAKASLWDAKFAAPPSPFRSSFTAKTPFDRPMVTPPPRVSSSPFALPVAPARADTPAGRAGGRELRVDETEPTYFPPEKPRYTYSGKTPPPIPGAPGAPSNPVPNELMPGPKIAPLRPAPEPTVAMPFGVMSTVFDPDEAKRWAEQKILGDVDTGPSGIARALNKGPVSKVDEGPDMPLFRPEAGTGHGALRGAAEFVGGLATPSNLLVMGGTAGLGRLGGAAAGSAVNSLSRSAISKAISLGFSAQMFHGGMQLAPQMVDAVKRASESDSDADWDEARRLAMHLGLGMYLTHQGIKHAFEGSGTALDHTRFEKPAFSAALPPGVKAVPDDQPWSPLPNNAEGLGLLSQIEANPAKRQRINQEIRDLGGKPPVQRRPGLDSVETLAQSPDYEKMLSEGEPPPGPPSVAGLLDIAKRIARQYGMEYEQLSAIDRESVDQMAREEQAKQKDARAQAKVKPVAGPPPLTPVPASEGVPRPEPDRGSAGSAWERMSLQERKDAAERVREQRDTPPSWYDHSEDLPLTKLPWEHIVDDYAGYIERGDMAKNPVTLQEHAAEMLRQREPAETKPSEPDEVPPAAPPAPPAAPGRPDAEDSSVLDAEIANLRNVQRLTSEAIRKFGDSLSPRAHVSLHAALKRLLASTEDPPTSPGLKEAWEDLRAMLSERVGSLRPGGTMERDEASGLGDVWHNPEHPPDELPRPTGPTPREKELGGWGKPFWEMTPEELAAQLEERSKRNPARDFLGDELGASKNLSGMPDWKDVEPVLREIASRVRRGAVTAADLVRQYGEAIRPHVDRVLEMARTAATDPQYARADGGKIKMGADVKALGEILGSSLYSGQPEKIIPKELLQNAMDAVRGTSGGKVSLHVGGQYDEHYNPTHEVHITVDDNGTGMTREQLETVFMDLGASGKRDQAGASGGFGLAKAAPLMMSKRLEVRTVVQEKTGKFEHSFTATPHELLGEGVAVTSRRVPATTPTGTTVRSVLDNTERHISAWHAEDMAKRYGRSIEAPGEIWVDDGDGGGLKNVTRGQALKPLAEHTIPGVATVKMYVGDGEAPVGEGSIGLEINNHGIYQFDHTMYPPGGSKMKGVPSVIAVDVQSLASEGSRDYPFTANREALRGPVLEAIERIVQEKVIDPAARRGSDYLGEKYAGLPTFHGTGKGKSDPPIPFYDVGGRMTPEETAAILRDPHMVRLARGIRDITNRVIAEINKPDSPLLATYPGMGLGVERVGITFDEKVHGVYHPNPKGKGATILINPFSFRDGLRPSQIAGNVWHTILHEIVHDKVKGHYEKFTMAESEIAAAAADVAISSIMELRGLYGDTKTSARGGLAVREDYAPAIRLYQESRGRPERERDPFGGEKQSVEPGGPGAVAAGNDGRLQPDRAGDVRVGDARGGAVGRFLADESGAFNAPSKADLVKWQRFVRQNWTNRYTNIDAYQKLAGWGVPAHENAAIAAHNFSGAPGKALAIIDRDLGRLIRKADKDGLLDTFVNYALGERYEELAGHGTTVFPDGRTIHHIRTDQRAMEAALGPQALAKVKAYGTQLRAINNGLIKMALDGGLITPEMYRASLSEHQKYIPLHRLQYFLDEIERGGQGAFTPQSFNVSKQDILKRISEEGSDKKVLDPLVSTMRRIVQVTSAVARNDVAQRIGDWSKLPQFKGVVTELKPAYPGGPVQLARHGMDTLSAMRAGRKVEYEVPRDLADEARNLNAKQVDLVSRFAKISSSILRNSTTSLNPLWALGNAFRDINTVTQVSPVGFNAKMWAQGFSIALAEKLGLEPDVYRKYLESGGAMSGYYGGLKKLPETVAQLREGTASKLAKKAIGPAVGAAVGGAVAGGHGAALGAAAGLWFSTAKDVGELIELAPRLGVFKKSLELGQPLERAGFNARRATVDFSRGGNTMRLLNNWVPFLNARTQGTITMFQSMNGSGEWTPSRKLFGAMRTPKQVAAWNAAKLGMLVGVPVVSTYLYNHRDEETARIYRDEIDAQTKKDYVVMILGPESIDEGNGRKRYTHVLRIPKGDIKAFANPVEAFLDSVAGESPKTLARLAMEVGSDISPVNFERDGKFDMGQVISSIAPPLAKAAVEDYTNKNTYTGRDIVPHNLLTAPPEDQYTKTTTNGAIWLGKKLGHSPAKIENSVNAQFGGAGRLALGLTGSQGKTGGNLTGQAFRNAFTSVRGGAKDQRLGDELRGIQERTQGVAVNLDRQADALVDKLNAMPLDERRRYFREAISNGTMTEPLAKAMRDSIAGRAAGLSPVERSLKQARIEDRAEFIYGQIQRAKPTEQKALLQRYEDTKILTDAVADRIRELASQKQGKPPGPPPVGSAR